MKKNTSKQFTHLGAIRIKKEQIPSTLDFLSTISHIPVTDFHLLGSTGKQKTSGDIDIAIDINKYDPQSTCETISHICKTIVYNNGNKIGSCLIPIEGDERNGMVQVDLMFIKNVEWAKFAYFSAGDKSKYKGVYRTCLLMGLAAEFEDVNITSFYYSDPEAQELIFRCGLTFSLNDGLHTICQYRPTYKNNPNRYQKRMITIPFEEAKLKFPQEMERIDKPISTLDPTEALQLLFKRWDINPERVETYEQLYSLIVSTHTRKGCSNIKKYAEIRMESFLNKL